MNNPALQALQYVIQNKNNYKLRNKRKSNTVLIFPVMTTSMHFEISNIKFFKKWFLVALLAASLQLPSLPGEPSTRLWNSTPQERCSPNPGLHCDVPGAFTITLLV